MPHYSRSFAVLFVTAVAVLAAGPNMASDQDPVKLAAQYIVQSQRQSGLFRYEFDFITGDYLKRNSLVRQAGAAYALAEYYRFTRDDAVVKAIQRAILGLEKKSIPWREGKLVADRGRIARARTGATALALLTELQYFEASGDRGNAETRKQWLRGLMSLRQPGSGFAKTASDKTESPYFDGEGWLALAYYNTLFPDDKSVHSLLADLDRYLMAKYGAEPNVSFFHWGVLAAVKRYDATGDQRFAAFAVDQAWAYLDELRPRVKSRVNSCFSVEGLAAAADVLARTGDNEELRLRVIRRIAKEMEKNLEFQISPGQDRIEFGEGRYLHASSIEDYVGAFLNGRYRPQTRIDFTQHCLSAMVKYRQFELYKTAPAVLALRPPEG